MKNLKLTSLLVAIVLVLGLVAGCAGASTTAAPAATTAAAGETTTAAAATTAAAGGKITVAVTNMTLKESVYKYMQTAAQKKADELGVNLIWQSCENDPQVQLNQVQDFIAKGANVIVIEPARSDAAVPMVKAANEANIPVINLEAEIKGIPTALRIVADSYKVGVMQAEDYINNVWDKKPANVVIASGTKGDEVAETITKGVLDTLAKQPDIKIVASQALEGWDRQLAMNMMQDALAKYDNNIQAVFANNDTMALGAMKAAEGAGVKDKIWFYGADHDSDSVKAILAGDNLKVVDKGAIKQGERIVEAAIAVAKGEAISEAQDVNGVKIWFTPIALVQKNALDLAKEKYPELFK